MEILLKFPSICMDTYTEKLNVTKRDYPFARWRESYENGIEQYTQENCDEVKNIFDTLITSLIALGEDATETEKITLFQTGASHFCRNIKQPVDR